MDISKDQFMIIIEKLKFNGQVIEQAAKDDIRSYLDRQVTDTPAAPTNGPTVEDTPGEYTPEQVAMAGAAAKTAMWGNHSLSYYDIIEWYDMTEKETKCIPNKTTGNGLCPFAGKHYHISTGAEDYGDPNTVSTGGVSILVCKSHQHQLSKRDQTRKLMAWVKTNTGIMERRHKTWKVSDFPQDLQGRIIMFLENRGDKPSGIQVYNQAPAAVQATNPMGLVMGQPGVIKCAQCQGLVNQASPLCPNCGQSPTTGMQKAGAFLGGLATMGAGIAQAQVMGQVNNQMSTLPKYCPRCSVQNPGTNMSCSNCGQSLSAQPPPTQQQYQQTPQY
jgi:hypothetical protein